MADDRWAIVWGKGEGTEGVRTAARLAELRRLGGVIGSMDGSGMCGWELLVVVEVVHVELHALCVGRERVEVGELLRVQLALGRLEETHGAYATGSEAVTTVSALGEYSKIIVDDGDDDGGSGGRRTGRGDEREMEDGRGRRADSGLSSSVAQMPECHAPARRRPRQSYSAPCTPVTLASVTPPAAPAHRRRLRQKERDLRSRAASTAG